jgi:hypothetical protein
LYFKDSPRTLFKTNSLNGIDNVDNIKRITDDLKNRLSALIGNINDNTEHVTKNGNNNVEFNVYVLLIFIFFYPIVYFSAHFLSAIPLLPTL